MKASTSGLHVDECVSILRVDIFRHNVIYFVIDLSSGAYQTIKGNFFKEAFK